MKQYRLLLLVLLSSATLGAQQIQTHHDRAFWRAIAQQHYAVPTGESASALAHELSSLLASLDSELRDDLAYSILAHWIARSNVLQPEQLLPLADEWRENLHRLQEEDRKGWANALTPEALARYQNHTYFFQALAVHMDLEPESSKIAEFMQLVLGILRTR
jgi:hypothetical protein